MRPIEFRVWDDVSKKMHYRDISIVRAYYGKNRPMQTKISLLNYEQMPEYVNGNRLHLMQFTGLIDKHGKEIYEGDFIIINNTEFDGINENKIPIYVEFKAAGFVDSYFHWHLVYESYYMEVIGNIFKSPELLVDKGKDNGKISA